MHPAIIFAMLVLLCAVGPYVLSLVAAAAVVAAFVIGVVEFCVASMSGFNPDGTIDHLRIAPPEPTEGGPDPAFRSYYAGPVLLDYQKVLIRTFAQMWARVVAAKPDERGATPSLPAVKRVWAWNGTTVVPSMLSVPTAFAATCGLFAGVFGAMAFVAFTSAVFLLLLVLVVFALVAAGGLRVVEFGALFLRGITIECPECHEKVTKPIYRCPTCDAAHRSLVPGRTGVLRRTCRCHNTLPTLLARGKSKLRGQCGHCKHELPTKGLTAPTVHIPVIAGPKAGKSVYMHSAVSRLMMRENGFEFADERAKDNFERNLRLGVHEDPGRALKTATVKPHAYNVFVGKEGSRARRLLYLYDPAGEHVQSVDHLADAQFLTFTKGIVFIVDPFSLRQVRSETDRSVLSKVSASHTAPKDVLERFVEALLERGVARKANQISIPVAVVLTKSDGLLDPSGPGHPYAGVDGGSREERDAAIRGWLGEVDQRSLVTSLDNHFTTVSYFAVSYQDAVEVSEHENTLNDDPALPLLWLLDRKAIA